MSQPILTKTCSSCGVQKSLSAFLQLGGPQGTHYGNICNACRKANKDKPALSKEQEDSTTSQTGFKIDSKTKVKEEVDKRERRQKIEDDYYDDREKESEKIDQKTQTIAQHEEKEKDHRENFLKKRPVKETKKETPIVDPGSTNLLDIAERELQTDLTAPFLDTQIAGKLKFAASPLFQQFLSLLPDSPITHHAKQIRAAQKQQNLMAAKTKKQAAETKTPKKNETSASSDYIEKKWGPGTKR